MRSVAIIVGNIIERQMFQHIDVGQTNDVYCFVMIKKIISCGQTVADKAALDAAIKLNISHGGWIPKGRITEDGPLLEKYQLEEMPTSSYAERTEQNVIDSDGTLIVSHGELTGGSAYTRELGLEHKKPWLHIDLNKTSIFDAAMKLSEWILKNNIEILNVAGPRASKDPRIYKAAKNVIESAFYMECLNLNAHNLLKVSFPYFYFRKTFSTAFTISSCDGKYRL